MKKHTYYLILVFLFSFSVDALSQSFESVILPKPTSVKKTHGEYKLPEELQIYAPKNEMESSYFIEELKDLNKGVATIIHDKSKGNLNLSVNPSLVKSNEGYRLTVSPKKIDIIGHDDAGVFYGLQSLLQLIYAAEETGAIPAQEVNDAPTFAWRAYMIDEGRYFKGEKEVYQILDEMAALKLNTMHCHLTEDGGWRI